MTLLRSHLPKSGAWLLGILVLPLISCSFSPPPAVDYDAMFDEAEALLLEAKWKEAHTVLREFLKANPDHPGAHFYLGRSYLFLEDDFRPTIAEGELQTALALYTENGGKSFIKRFNSPNYFPLICNIESAKVSIKEYAFLSEFKVPPGYLAAIVERARHYTEEARKISPNSNDVADFDELIGQLEIVTLPNGYLEEARGRSYYLPPKI